MNLCEALHHSMFTRIRRRDWPPGTYMQSVTTTQWEMVSLNQSPRRKSITQCDLIVDNWEPYSEVLHGVKL
jgi:hypothetical protein